MKRIVLLLFGSIILSACSQKDEVANVPVCGIDNPLQNIAWLSDLVLKPIYSDSQEDYRGQIWVVKYKGQDIIVSTLSHMYTMDQMYKCYDCEGEIFEPSDSDDFHKILSKDKVLIYSKP